jgi:hypothetical protein
MCPVVSGPRRSAPVSGSALVLVDDPAEDVMATDWPAMVEAGAWLGYGEAEAPVWPGLVVVAHVLVEHAL